MDIKDRLRTFEEANEERWFPFGEDRLELRIKPMTEEEFNSLSRRSQREQYHKHQRFMEIDVNRLNAEIIKTALLDWRGMTGAIFCGYAHVSRESFARECGIQVAEIDKTQVGFDMETALYIGRRCMGFADAIYNMARQLVGEQAVATKN